MEGTFLPYLIAAATILGPILAAVVVDYLRSLRMVRDDNANARWLVETLRRDADREERKADDCEEQLKVSHKINERYLALIERLAMGNVQGGMTLSAEQIMIGRDAVAGNAVRRDDISR